MGTYKGILLDIDDTLYDYDTTHSIAFQELLKEAEVLLGRDRGAIESAFKEARNHVHNQLDKTASSHNRLLYIQGMLEHLEINALGVSLKLYECYWGTFLENMHLRDGAHQFLEHIKNKKVCLLTDLTAHIQHRKVEKLGLYKYADYMVTSEEVGVEKPHPEMFIYGLKKLDMKAEEVCMIGDNYKKDIMGASHIQLKSFWINTKSISQPSDDEMVTEFKSFKELIGLIDART